MPQAQTNIQISAPGFAGLNTQDSPIDQPLSFAATAENCVIDELGRIASRRGFQTFTQDPETVGNMGDNPVETCFEFVQRDGTYVSIIAAEDDGGSNDLWKQASDGSLTKLTNVAQTANNWDYAQLDDEVYLAQASHDIYYYDGTTFAVMTQQPAAATNGLTDPDIILAGFGCLWCARGTGDYQTVQYSTPAIYGTTLATASTPWSVGGGRLNVGAFWPTGSDEITALAVHNGRLIIFGRHSILVYVVPDTGPDDMYLEDTIENIGCIARDSVVSVGSDLWFLDSSGMRSLNRTIQETSLPIGDVSQNIREEIIDTVASSTLPIRSVYSPEESLVVLMIPSVDAGKSICYVFDTRRPLEGGAYRVTTWKTGNDSDGIRCGMATEDGLLLLGKNGGTYQYTGGEDTSVITGAPENTSQAISMTYSTHPQTFGKPANLKFPKQLDMTLIGGSDITMDIQWFFDYRTNGQQTQLVREVDEGAVWGTAEWGTASWGTTGGLITQTKHNLWGSGTVVRFQFSCEVSNNRLSIQELNIQSLLGRML